MSQDKIVGTAGAASGGKPDTELNEALKKFQGNDEYKVLTKADYENLLALAKKNMTTGSPRLAQLLTPSPATQGAKPKFTFAYPNTTPTPVPRLQHTANFSHMLNTSYVPQNFTFPKLPVFSGSEVPQKGEATYEVWSFEVKCLKNIQELPEHTLLQSIRNSLRGSARDMLIPLGEKATVDEILEKLEGFYGMASSGATLMQTFYNDFQKDSESIVSYGTRLEQALSRAVTYGHIELAAKDSILRSKFWTGLRSQQLKNSTHHLYDARTDFQSLLKEIRKVESEDASCSRPASKQKAKQQSGQAEKEQSKEDKILSQLSELMGKMTSMERELESQKQTIASGNNQSSSHRQSCYNQRGCKNYNRGNYGRGNYGRGNNGRGGFGRGYGRGYQGNRNNSQNENSRGSFRGGRSRGGYRGGTSSRGANRGDASNRSDQPLNS